MPLFQPPICPHCQQHLPVPRHYLVASRVCGFDPVCPHCTHCQTRSSLSRSGRFSLLMLFMLALLTMPFLALWLGLQQPYPYKAS